jgi:hypothetical protein
MDEFHIKNAIGTVKAIDGDSLLSPQTLERIVNAVLSAVDERQLRRERSKADTSVTSGVASEQEHA